MPHNAIMGDFITKSILFVLKYFSNPFCSVHPSLTCHFWLHDKKMMMMVVLNDLNCVWRWDIIFS
jgi:hypothetical protein